MATLLSSCAFSSGAFAACPSSPVSTAVTGTGFSTIGITDPNCSLTINVGGAVNNTATGGSPYTLKSAISVNGTDFSLFNSGSISATPSPAGIAIAHGLFSAATITNVTSGSSIYGNLFGIIAWDGASIGTLSNFGKISAGNWAGVWLEDSIVTSFINQVGGRIFVDAVSSGSLESGQGVFLSDNGATANGLITTFDNYGSITGANKTSVLSYQYDAAIWIYQYGNGTARITTLNNHLNAVLESINGGSGISLTGANASIGTLNNEGTIRSTGGSGDGIWIDGGVITAINNTGVISSIYNQAGVIGTLNNAQSALQYRGTLPSYYNVIVTATGYGSLVVASGSTGSMTVGISSLSSAANTSNMMNVVSGVSAGEIANVGQSVSYTFGGQTYTYVVKDIDGNGTYDLEYGSPTPGPTPWSPNAENTTEAMLANANALRSVMAYQLTNLAFMTGYDCAVFDKSGACISFQARYSGTNALNTGAGVLTAAYRIAEQFRVGAFIDYAGTGGTPSGVSLDNQLPAFGAFAGFSQKLDGTGLQGKIIGVFQNGNVTVGRSNALADTEAGSGKSSLNSYAIAGEIGWGYAINPTLLATPFIGIRYSNSTRGGYTEWGADTVLYPISYNGFSEWMTTAAIGVRFNGMLSEKVGYQVGAGIEYDLTQNVSQYSGSSTIPGLTTFSLATEGADNRFRGFGQVGMFYQVDKNQRLIGNVAVRNQAFSAPAAVSAMAGYQVSF